MKCLELDAALKKSGPAPLYVIVGEEDLLRDRAVAAIKAAAVPSDSGMIDFNLELIYGDEADAAEILAKAQEAPAFAERRCIIVKGADKLSAGEGERLIEYLKQPVGSTTLAFVAPKLDGRTKFAQALKQTAVTVECGLPFEATLPDWIRAEAAAVGVLLDDEAIGLLKDLIVSLKETTGGVLYLLRRELEKLAAYVPAGTIATAANVDAIRGGEGGASVFDLSHALAARDRVRVLRILARNLDAGEDPLRILGSLVWQYRKLWRLKHAGSEAEAARMFRIQPFKVREFLGRFSEAHLAAAFRLFLETDSKLKGGAPAAARARTLEALLLALCEPAAAPRPSAPRPESPRPQPSRVSNVRTVKKLGQ